MLSIELVNKRQRESIADYYFKVKVNGAVIAEGWLEGHNRSDGWQALVKKFGDMVWEDEQQRRAANMLAVMNLGEATKVSHQ
jgi:hypothetical protein